MKQIYIYVIIFDNMYNELSKQLEYPFYLLYLTNQKICYLFRDEMFHLSL